MFVGFVVSLAGGALLLFVSALVDAHALGVIGVLCAMVGVGVFVPL